MSTRAVTLHRYTEADRPALRALSELYAHDFSEFVEMVFTDAGHFVDERRFERNFVDVYRVFLIRCDGNLAGFVILDDKSQLDGAADVHDILQFFILRGYRRHGVGARAAQAVFDAFPGRWEVRQMDENHAAQVFWRRVVERYTGGEFTEARWQDEDGGGIVQRFTARPLPRGQA